jgi:DNA-3-methyladenine glycosylase I
LKKQLVRCAWCESDPLLLKYHDEEWGVPISDGRELWEKLMLDGFQAGLSWLTILRKRENFRKAFKNFDPKKIVKFTEADIEKLMQNEGIIRSRSKIEAAIGNACAYLNMTENGEDFADFVWEFAGHKPIQNTNRKRLVKSPLSEEISKELKRRGFKFVGPVIVYAWMQAVGMVNDHDSSCFRHPQILKLSKSF